MRKSVLYFFIPFLISGCNSSPEIKRDIITVSIAPFRYFVNAIAGKDFDVNVMVPASADPHVYEPAPGQIAALSRSAAYISDGYLGFEITWLDRFFETNRKMKRISLSQNIDLIRPKGSPAGNIEGADPHYWVSPKSAYLMAFRVKDLLCSLKPENREKYEKSYLSLLDTIATLDRKAARLFEDFQGKTFMIFHPALGYIARDYHLVQLSVETEGKEPSPSSMKALIDNARKEKIKIILVQKGFDTKNAGAIAMETGSVLRPVDPLGENWPENVSDILEAIRSSFENSAR